MKHPDKKEIMHLEKVTDNIFAETSGENGGNMGAVILNDQVVIIDSGMFHHKTKKISDELAEYQLPIRNLILTHAHSDHVFGAQAFETASIISSEGTRDYCMNSLNDQWNKERLVEYAESMKAERPEFSKAVQDLEIRNPDVVYVSLKERNDAWTALTEFFGKKKTGGLR